MFVKFVAHAGIFIQEGNTSVLIDPWFTDSTREKPIVEGLSGLSTIDFQIPKTEDVPENYHPDAILISHLHPHHAPIRDVCAVTEQGHEITLFFPKCKESEIVKERMGIYKNLSCVELDDEGSFSKGTLKMTAFAHTAPEHLAWFIEGKTGKILHIADARVNMNYNTSESDKIWKKFENLGVDILFLSAGRNSRQVKSEKIEDREIYEATGLSPIQGAKLVKLIKPRAVSLIGMYNHSIWRNRLEFIPSSAQTEEEFAWANSWLNPESKFVRVFPGHTFGLQEEALASKVDTYL